MRGRLLAFPGFDSTTWQTSKLPKPFYPGSACQCIMRAQTLYIEDREIRHFRLPENIGQMDKLVHPCSREDIEARWLRKRRLHKRSRVEPLGGDTGQVTVKRRAVK